MDLNSLVESGQVLWAFVGTLGVSTAINILTFMKTSLGGKKITKMSDFAVVADKSMKYAKSEFATAKEQIVTETKKQIIEPLQAQVKGLISDNAQLASLCVSLVSLIPMPLDVKKNAVNVISTINNVSVEAKTLLEASVVAQEQQELVQQEQDNELQENINNI